MRLGVGTNATTVFTFKLPGYLLDVPLFHFASQDKALLAKILDLTLNFIPYTKSVGAGRVVRKF